MKTRRHSKGEVINEMKLDNHTQMETTVLKKGQVYVGVREEETGYEDHSDAKCWLFCGGVSSHMSEGPYSLVAQQCNET